MTEELIQAQAHQIRRLEHALMETKERLAYYESKEVQGFTRRNKIGVTYVGEDD